MNREKLEQYFLRRLIPDFRLQISDLRFQILGFRFHISELRFQVSYFRFQIPYSRFQIRIFNLPVFANSRLGIQAFRISRFANCRLPHFRTSVVPNFSNSGCCGIHALWNSGMLDKCARWGFRYLQTADFRTSGLAHFRVLVIPGYRNFCAAVFRISAQVHVHSTTYSNLRASESHLI